MARHFHCTECGRCCKGWLPLTLDDALLHAGRFPLAVIFSPLRQGASLFDHTARLGARVTLANGKQLAVRIAPTAYIPPSQDCPELAEDGRCKIYDARPSRCRTMPFSPYRGEDGQDDLLVPRDGWECDVSEAAPIVYRDGKILDRSDFNFEADALQRQPRVLGPYADWLLQSVPTLRKELANVSKKRLGGHVVVSFVSLLPRMPDVDAVAFAGRQLPVLRKFLDLTAGKPAHRDYHRRYRDYADELARIANSGGTVSGG
jgi:Fe-S-cluster containining protein